VQEIVGQKPHVLPPLRHPVIAATGGDQVHVWVVTTPVTIP
jgi:hypothetical protein